MPNPYPLSHNCRYFKHQKQKHRYAKKSSPQTIRILFFKIVEQSRFLPLEGFDPCWGNDVRESLSGCLHTSRL